MSKQNVQTEAKQKKEILLPVLGIVAILAVIGMIVALAIPKDAPETSFTPPPFDSAAVVGTPTVPDGLGYKELYQEGMTFKVSVCGRVEVDGNTADVYFTNPESNGVWMKLRILDENGNTLGETGLIKPGEYLKTITFDTVPDEGTPIKMKIMTYEPETYISTGSIVLNTTVRK